MHEKSKFEKSFWRSYDSFKSKLKNSTESLLDKIMSMFAGLGEEKLLFHTEEDKIKYIQKRKLKTLFFLLFAPLIIWGLVYFDTKDSLTSFKSIPIYYMFVAFGLLKYKALSKTVFIPIIRIITIPAYILYYLAGAYVFGRFLIARPRSLIFGKVMGLKASMFWGFIVFFIYERFLLDSVIAEYKISSFKDDKWKKY